jgi:hypothetical protein
MRGKRIVRPSPPNAEKACSARAGADARASALSKKGVTNMAKKKDEKKKEDKKEKKGGKKKKKK